MWKLLPLVALLLSACAQTVGSADAICAIPTPTFTEKELVLLSDQTLSGLDLYAAQLVAACNL